MCVSMGQFLSFWLLIAGSVSCFWERPACGGSPVSQAIGSPTGANTPVFPDDIRKSALQATIRIVALKPPGTGSGVALGMKDGYCYALTARHVVFKVRQFEVFAQTDTGTQKFETVDVLASLPESDLALIRFAVGKSEIACMSLAPKRAELKEFPFPVLNSGWEQGDGATCAEDQVLARKLLRHPDGASAFVWQTHTTSEPGRSGGPLISARGEVIGICSGNQDGNGFFAHRDEIHYFLRKHCSSPWLLPKSAQIGKFN